MTDATSTQSTFSTETADSWHGDLPQSYSANDDAKLDIIHSYVTANVKMTVKRRVSLIAKRMFDIVTSAIAIVLFFIPFLVIATMIKRESAGPAIFRQTRWGKDQAKIQIYKLRTMRHDVCDESGVKQTINNDPRTTQLGAFLRKNNIDELPQLVNVFKGEMSLIGPRPHVIGMYAGGVPYEQLVTHYHSRHIMKPGITGLAQISGLRGPTVNPDRAIARIDSDIQYVNTYSLFLDLKILWVTVWQEMWRGSGS